MASFPKPPTLNDDRRAVDIYRRAAVILRERGFDATSMGDIADAVDLTKGGLYYYIKGKQALLFAIMCFALEQVENQVLKPALEVDDAETRVARWVEGHTILMLDDPAPMMVLYNELEALKPEHRLRVDERLNVSTNTLRDAIEVLVAERSTLDVDIATGAIRTLVEGVANWSGGVRADHDAIVRQVTRMAMDALLGHTEAARAVA
ncbi:MAG: TetR/AcrR family transcriptional regulator [Thermoanaerobaculia bacterium]|nr:TetR/AcrR family transcriptional regulator [Thermoanaerobaculia bacterium]